MADATSKLRVEFVADASQLGTGINQAQSSFAKLSGAVAAGSLAAQYFSEGMHKAIGFLASSVKAASESDSAIAELGAVLNSTSNIAGVTEEQAIKLSKSLESVTTFSDEAVMHAESMALTFTNLGRSVFPDATEAILNLATMMGQDVKTSAIQLGKALNDPADRIGALTRMGVTFNKQQIEMVQNLQNSGRGLDAQRYILHELATEFGGQARAAALTFGGQLKQLSNSFDDVKERIGGMIGAGLRPLVQVALDFINKNEPLVASLVAAGTAATIMAGGLMILATAAVLLWSALGPVAIILLTISALAGVVVFNAMQKFQKQMGDTSHKFSQGSKSIASDGANNFGAAGQAASDLAKKLAQIDEQIAKSERDFRESMAKIVKDHQQKVSQLKSQLDDENKSFEDSQAKKNQDFQHSQQDQKDSHMQKVQDIQDQIDQEAKKGIWANKFLLADLQKRLNQENSDYEKATQYALTQYQQDTQNALEQHTKKANDLQTQLDQEKAFLQQHDAEVKASRTVTLLDEIDSLKRTHAEELASFQKQKNDAISSAKQTTAGINSALGGIGQGLNPDALRGIGGDMGRGMAKALKDAIFSAIADLPRQIWNTLVDGSRFLASVASRATHGISDLTGPGAILRLFSALPKFASGVQNFAGGVAIVGENGPEMVELPKGSNVIPNHQVRNGGQVFNITINGDFSGSGGPQNLADILTHQLKMAGRY